MDPRRGDQRRGDADRTKGGWRDALEHPGPREIQAVEVSKLGIAGVGHHARREPAGSRALVDRDRGQELAQPAREFRLAAGRAGTRSASARQGDRKSSPEGS